MQEEISSKEYHLLDVIDLAFFHMPLFTRFKSCENLLDLV